MHSGKEMVLWGKKKKYLENEISLKNKIREVKEKKNWRRKTIFLQGKGRMEKEREENIMEKERLVRAHGWVEGLKRSS